MFVCCNQITGFSVRFKNLFKEALLQMKLFRILVGRILQAAILF